MKTAQQKITELRERLSFGAKVSRVLLGLVIISLTTNVVLGLQIYGLKVKQIEDVPTIVSTGTIEKTGDNTFTIIPDEALPSYDLPPVPQHLK